MATIENVRLKDNFKLLDKKYNRKIIYHGDPNIIKPMKTGLQSSEGESPIAATVLGINNTSIPLPDDHDTKNYWTDHDALESYLKMKPTCYLILGTKGCGNFVLGDVLSKKNNCIHLSPKQVILDEIEQNKTTGKVIDFNMRHNKVCKYNIVFALLKQKLQSSAIKHRGFVISGLPLIDSRTNINYVTHKLVTEEAYSVVEEIVQELLNFKKKKIDTEGVENEEDEVDKEGEVDKDDNKEAESFQLPKFLLNSCKNVVIRPRKIYDAKKSIIFKQVKELFELNPDIIINVSFPYNDLAYRRNNKYYNYMSNTRENNPFPTISNDFEIRWPSTYVTYDYNKPIDNRIFNPKYNCIHPINFHEMTFKQICNYKYHINNYIEEKLKEFHPSKIFNIDGRTPLPENIHNIQKRLSLMMTIHPVIIPEPLYFNDPSENIDTFWNHVEKLNVIRSGVLNFFRHSSPWYNRCPVELHHRRSIQGKIKYSVIFYKYIFLMSSLNAMSLFCKNPRPYLKLNYLEPTCRVIIIGTKSSGKSMIAKCLSWIFDAPIVCYAQYFQKMKQEKYYNFSKNILSEIIATIEDKRFAEWEMLELERTTKLSKWVNEVSSNLNKYVSLLKAYPDEPSEIDESKLNKSRDLLSFLPILNDLESCVKALKDHTLILQYAPSNLTIVKSKPSTPVLGDEDVVQSIIEYISSNNLEMDVLPTTEELMSGIINILKSIDLKAIHTNKRFGKFIIDGFPSDPEFWEHLIDSEILPDYTIAICDSREIDSDILDHYEAIETSIKSYYDRIFLGTDTLIKTKLYYNSNIDTITPYVQSLLDNILQKSMGLKKNINEDKSEEIEAFTEAINSFKGNWDSLKSKLDGNNKSFVIVEIEDKSDIQVLDEALLKIRKCYGKQSSANEDKIDKEIDIEEAAQPHDILSFNESNYLGDTNVYCPICFYDFDILWKGKQQLSIKYNNRIYYFNSQECSNMFQNDPTKYQQYNLPFKNNPSVKICIVGCIGSGKSIVAKKIAKELGLLYIDFDYFINTFLLPRHFKKVGWKYENSFTDTPVGDDIDIQSEFQIDEENLALGSEIFGNEREFRRIVQNYFEQGNPLPSTWVQILLQKLWKETPFHNTGIVIDGFPKSLTDVKDMLTCFCIPDLVIELKGNNDTTLRRLSPQFSEIWEKQLSEAKLKAEIEFKMKHDKWTQFITRTVIGKLIIDDLLDNMIIVSEHPPETESTKNANFDALSVSVKLNDNLITYLYELIEQYPEPVDENEWETFDNALIKMKSRWERIFEKNENHIKEANEHLMEQNIKVTSINGKKSHDNVFRNVLSKLTFIRNRCKSFLEQTFVLSCDIAEMLLLEGFLLLSRFHRLCPVHISENSSTILHTYIISKNQDRLYPVIHRSYIYFISSKENLIKFRKNPLMYVGTDILKSYQQYPLRIGIIGPPKSGKSKLTSKLANRYGLLCVSKGMAIRHILEEMRWTDLGLRLENMIRTGKCVDNELIMKAILIVLMDFRASTNGFVLDGFPETPYECCELLKYGIYPFIIFNLNSSLQTIEINSQRKVYYDIIKEKPPYPKSFITCRYNSWISKFKILCDWIKQDTQNVYFINSNNSQWRCHFDAIKIIELIIPKIHYYLKNVDNQVVSVSVFGISNKCFEKKMSRYKNICPMCLRKNILRHSGYPPDKSGLVQYKDTFYWICAEHLEHVLNNSSVLTDSQDVKIPDIPVVTKNVYKPLVYEDGICLVTYAESLPSQKIINGTTEFAAIYSGKTYLFCTSECLNKFLATPQLYYDITVFKEFKNLPKLSLKSLPNIGYLEQTIGNIITEACCAVNVIRPKYPGIDIRLSALLYIGLFLKTFNPLVDKSQAPIYKKSLKSFEYRSKLLTSIGKRFRSMKNPFAVYPPCCDGIECICFK